MNFAISIFTVDKDVAIGLEVTHFCFDLVTSPNQSVRSSDKSDTGADKDYVYRIPACSNI